MKQIRDRTQDLEIRKAITRAGYFDFQVAKRLQISEAELHEWIKYPLIDGRRDKILRAIGQAED